MKSTKPKPFEKLTAAQKRVAIARDVVKQIRAKKYSAGSGYATVFASGISKAILASKPKCTVCAIGAAMVSAVRLGNKFEVVPDFSCEQCTPNYGFCFQVVFQWFGKRRALLIEEAFEGFGHSPVAKAFRYRYPDRTKRLSALFLNIIRNHGEFKP